MTTISNMHSGTLAVVLSRDFGRYGSSEASMLVPWVAFKFGKLWSFEEETDSGE